MEEGFEERFEEVKRASVAQLMFRCARLLNERAMALVRERTGYKQFREAHTRLFPHIDLEGTRLTELARRLGVSKQATAQWVDELQAFGVLEKVPDPNDGRARLIRFSEEGRVWLFKGMGFLGELDKELEEELGEASFQAFHEQLLSLQDWLDRD